ncbi:helix-hairpin-helix domain-containing protein [Spirosoma sp. KUDC1026]|uniref:helix-hairpin-helix domain-containing protein n=1 Tax=Spirosoma sp. KUDC1026 TaxID=2745947 RepID=UPI00159BBF4B|nr:helix-hairpin-helix domain-containing protein [Spirosoma sp. KUDC1026]QKZ13110.1 helix-hairpin-helix domain-containing protein [Spirosoma sp. KUDC1026]
MLSRFQSLVRDYFGLSHREVRGFLVLLLLIVFCLLIPFAYRFLVTSEPADTSLTDQRKLDSLVALMKTEEAKQPAFGAREQEKTTTERFSEPKLFAFDPNTASVADWQQLGLPRWMAERIEKYRNKGGTFRRKEDLLKIYDFPAELYDQLEPYITLKSASPADYGNAHTGRRPAFDRDEERVANRPAYTERYVKPALQPFDINTADTAQLIALKGIGVTLASRIVKYRDALGGFYSTEQFREVYGLDSLALGELTKFGKIQTAARKVAINTASAEELDRFPFLSRRQAQTIVSYREQHGAYTSADALKPIRLLDAKTIEKLTPYISF